MHCASLSVCLSVCITLGCVKSPCNLTRSGTGSAGDRARAQALEAAGLGIVVAGYRSFLFKPVRPDKRSRRAPSCQNGYVTQHSSWSRDLDIDTEFVPGFFLPNFLFPTPLQYMRAVSNAANQPGHISGLKHASHQWCHADHGHRMVF